MLKKILSVKLKIFSIIVLSLIALQLITGYVFGFVVKSQVDAQFKYYTDSPFIKVVNRTYHRGIFSSDVTTELAINSQVMANILKMLPKNGRESQTVETTYTINYVTHIQHGLFAGLFHGEFLPVIAYSSTEIQYPEELKKMLNKFFNGKKPLEISDTLYLNKSGKIEAFSPAFNYEEAVSGVKLKWDGLNLTINYNDKLNKFKNKLNIPDFELIAPTKGQVIVNGLNYASDTWYSINNIKVGDANLNINLAQVAWNDKLALNFKLGDVLRMATGINSADFLNQIDVIDPNQFTFNKISYSSSSNDKNNYFNARAKTSFDALETNKKTYGPMRLDIAVDHVLSPQFSKLTDEIDRFTIKANNTQVTSNEEAGKLKDEFIKLLKVNFAPILVDKPQVTLATFELTTPNGLIKLAGTGTTNNFQLTDIEDYDKFMSKLDVDFNFSIPKPEVAYLFVLQMKYLLSAGNAEMDEQSSEALTKVVNILLDNQINTWTKKGYIKENNGVLESRMVFKDGQLVINDIPTSSSPSN